VLEATSPATPSNNAVVTSLMRFLFVGVTPFS
jgi:hypothetical protein